MPSESALPQENELQMVWPADQSPSWSIPSDYHLKLYQPGDEENFFLLMDRVGFPGWNQIEFEKYLQKIVPDGFFFLIHTKSNSVAATAMGMHNPTDWHPFGGSLSCVGVDPNHQGKRLGSVISAIVTERLIQGGYKDIYLATDDWRLPAIKTYLNIGWVPFLSDVTMIDRWKEICQKLNWSTNTDSWISFQPNATKPS